ncbi:MAG: Manganese transport protein MntH [Thermoleophilia bacterium]|nr:Manganese transport protein MntH [Thermoleophilia bacterium]
MTTPPSDNPRHQSRPVDVGSALPGERRVLEAARRSLDGRRRGVRGLWPFLGPAFIAAVAYVDPGNFATNIAAGSTYGYTLLWVILASNLMAMLIQSMSAKLGIATGRNLAEVSRDRFPTPVRLALWAQAELVAMATDLAEFIGASLALNLLFDIPLLAAACITGVVSFAILELQTRGFRHFEAAIAGLVGLIVIGFAFSATLADPDAGDILHGLLTPRFEGSDSVLLAVGIIGATVMPHVIYLHSALTQQRVTSDDDEVRRRIFRFELVDVVLAMGIAGIVNMSMLIMAAAAFHARGMTGVDDIDEAFVQLGVVLGNHVDIVFGVALLASGISSSSVGTLAGQVVMQGYLQRSIPLFLRRAITMAPAFVIIAAGVNPSTALVMSQVALSFGIPFALIPLVWFCRDRELMGTLVNHRITTALGTVVVAAIVSLNVYLLGSLVT